MENLNLFSTAVDGMQDVNRLITLLHDNINSENQRSTLAELTLIAHETSRFVNELATRYLLVEQQVFRYSA